MSTRAWIRKKCVFVTSTMIIERANDIHPQTKNTLTCVIRICATMRCLDRIESTDLMWFSILNCVSAFFTQNFQIRFAQSDWQRRGRERERKTNHKVLWLTLVGSWMAVLLFDAITNTNQSTYIFQDSAEWRLHSVRTAWIALNFPIANLVGAVFFLFVSSLSALAVARDAPDTDCSNSNVNDRVFVHSHTEKERQRWMLRFGGDAQHLHVIMKFILTAERSTRMKIKKHKIK